MSDNTNPTQPDLVLVVGGNGKTGRRVAERLTALDVPVRRVSRSTETPFDWEDPTTWAAAVEGAAKAYVTYHPDLAFPGATEQIRDFTEVAVAAGVRHLVLLSGRSEPAALASEKVVQDSGADWTIVRSDWFAQNFSEGFLVDPVLAGVLALPAGDVAVPFVDVDDIADVATAALTQPGHAGRAYEVTGPRLLTFADVAAELSAASGRDVRYLPVTSEQFAEVLAGVGLPADHAAALNDLFAEILDGRNASLADGIRQALGREPKDFADYARDAAATGAWDVAS